MLNELLDCFVYIRLFLEIFFFMAPKYRLTIRTVFAQRKASINSTPLQDRRALQIKHIKIKKTGGLRWFKADLTKRK